MSLVFSDLDALLLHRPSHVGVEAIVGGTVFRWCGVGWWWLPEGVLIR